MKTTDILLKKIMEFEGCRLEAYRDAAGVPTIGYGHTKDVRMGDRITAWCAKEYLRQDIEEAEQQVAATGRGEDRGAVGGADGLCVQPRHRTAEAIDTAEEDTAAAS